MPQPSIRFLLTDSCNIRCHYCHNEFQGFVSSSARPAWNMRTVSQLLAKAAKDSPTRVKFSGGEPLLRWHDLLSLTKRNEAMLEGDIQPFMTNLQYFKDLLALPRKSGGAA